MNILDALVAFQLQLEADGRSPHTGRQYCRHIRLLARWLEAEGIGGEIAGITAQIVARFLVSPAARTRPDGGAKSSATMNALRTSIRCFFAYCELAGFVERSPGMLVRRAICAPPPPRGLSDDEVEHLLEAAAEIEGDAARRDEMFVRLLLGTGLRMAEALALEVGDVDLGRGELTVRRAKGDRPRTAYLPVELGERLASWMEDREGRLFPVGARHAQRRIGEVAWRAGLEGVSAHSLRHTTAMQVYKRSGDLGVVQAVLGHASIQTTTRYARVDEERVRVAVGA